jgi:murein L,D-transpeptidase YafK
LKSDPAVTKEEIMPALSVYLYVILIFAASILDQQKDLPRVKSAISEKLKLVERIFQEKNTSFPPDALFLRIFKAEKSVEVWAKAAEIDTFTLIKSYNFCASSGTLGPKRKQGDLQIPEGFYHLSAFNPYSRFYLSLRINYPNELDRLLGDKNSPGGDIFIHGDCVTIGCIPITDDLIKELYVMALYTVDDAQKNIPVHIFPTVMTNEKLAQINHISGAKHASFWDNLRIGFAYFEKYHKLPRVRIDRNSKTYMFD